LASSGNEFDNGGNGLPNAVPRRRLDTSAKIRREAVKQYLRWERGLIYAEVAGRMINALRVIMHMVEGPAIEQRLAAVEQRLAELSQP
jgi:hypothetical protein